MPLEGGRHLRGQRGREQAGTERDEELQPLACPGEHRRGEPGILTPCPGRGERCVESQLLGGVDDLTEIGQCGGPGTGGEGRRDAMTAPYEITTVPVGGQEPVKGECHDRLCEGRLRAGPSTRKAVAAWRAPRERRSGKLQPVLTA